MFEGVPGHNWLDRPVLEKEAEGGSRKWWPGNQHQSVQGVDFEGLPLGPPSHQQPRQGQPQQQPQQQQWWGGDAGVTHLSAPHSLGGAYPPLSVRQPHQVCILAITLSFIFLLFLQ